MCSSDALPEYQKILSATAAPTEYRRGLPRRARVVPGATCSPWGWRETDTVILTYVRFARPSFSARQDSLANARTSADEWRYACSRPWIKEKPEEEEGEI